jgi:hypothetical protein
VINDTRQPVRAWAGQGALIPPPMSIRPMVRMLRPMVRIIHQEARDFFGANDDSVGKCPSLPREASLSRGLGCHGPRGQGQGTGVSRQAPGCVNQRARGWPSRLADTRPKAKLHVKFCFLNFI